MLTKHLLTNISSLDCFRLGRGWGEGKLPEAGGSAPLTFCILVVQLNCKSPGPEISKEDLWKRQRDSVDETTSLHCFLVIIGMESEAISGADSRNGDFHSLSRFFRSSVFQMGIFLYRQTCPRNF
jgi:hypothetical protein